MKIATRGEGGTQRSKIEYLVVISSDVNYNSTKLILAGAFILQIQ